MPIRVNARRITIYWKEPDVTAKELKLIKNYWEQNVPLSAIQRKLQGGRTNLGKTPLGYVDLYTILYTMYRAGEIKQRRDAAVRHEMTIEDFVRFFNIWKQGGTLEQCTNATKGNTEGGMQVKNGIFYTAVYRMACNRWRREKNIIKEGFTKEPPASEKFLPFVSGDEDRTKVLEQIVRLLHFGKITIRHASLTEDQHPTLPAMFIPMNRVSTELLLSIGKYLPDLALLINPGTKTGAGVQELLAPPFTDAPPIAGPPTIIPVPDETVPKMEELEPAPPPALALPSTPFRFQEEEDEELATLDPNGEAEQQAKTQAELHDAERRRLTALLERGESPPPKRPTSSVDDSDLDDDADLEELMKSGELGLENLKDEDDLEIKRG